MGMNILNLDKINTSLEFEEKLYNLKITRCDLLTAATGSEMVQFDYEILGLPSPLFVKFDNCVIKKADGTMFRTGLVKLSKILEATKTKPDGDFPTTVLPALLMGKKFNAFVSKEETNGKTYLRLANLESIKPFVEEEFSEEEKEILEEQGIGITINSKDW